MTSRLFPRPGRRSRQRGAILIESLIVCSMLTLMLICGLFFHRLYAAKLRTIREARVQVWQAVNSPGCGGATIDLQAILGQAIANSSAADVITPGTAGGSTERPAFMGAIAHRSQASSSSVSAHADMGGGSYELKVANQVACNEVPASARGDVLSIFGFAAKNLLGAVW
jgi:hypothetical protein